MKKKTRDNSHFELRLYTYENLRILSFYNAIFYFAISIYSYNGMIRMLNENKTIFQFNVNKWAHLQVLSSYKIKYKQPWTLIIM